MESTCSPRTASLTGSELYKMYNPSIIQAQNIQRLRINRVALVQMLRVDHIVPKLLKNGVLSEQEHKHILTGKTQQDKTRKLLDILPNKGKDVDWYRNFKDALKNPETRSMESRKKYQILLEFLENTMIQIPPKPPAKPRPVVSPVDSGMQQKNYPRYETLPSISDGGSPDKPINPSQMISFGDGMENYNQDRNSSVSPIARESKESTDQEKGMAEENIQEKECKDQPTVVPQQRHLSNEEARAYLHQEIPIPENYKSLIHEPTEHLERLYNSNDELDQQLLQQEKIVFERAKTVEAAFALKRRGQLPPGLPLCFSKPVEDMLTDHENHHLYFKYFQKLYNSYLLDIPAEITVSFTEVVKSLENAQDDEVRQFCVLIGFELFEFMHDYGQYNKAETILLELMNFLSTCAQLDNWMALYEGLVKMMTACNTAIQFSETNHMHSIAEQMAAKIKLMSFGLDLLDESQMYTEMSIMLREQGSLGPAFHWAQKALKEVEADNHKGIVDVLCNAVLCYCAMWNVTKAEELAIQAVKYAKELFGVNSPMYVKALIHFVYYSNEFRQDEMGVEVAKKAVEISEKIYGGCSATQTAMAHEALAKALVVSLNFTDENYYVHTQKAWSIAKDVIPAQHPKLAPFKYTLAQVLQWRAMQVSFFEKENNLACAEAEAKDALAMFKTYWGTYSIKTAQAYSLLGQVYAKMERSENAEEMLLGAYAIYMEAVSPNSNLQPLMKATLGTFYRTIDKPLEAIDLLKDCLQKADSHGVYLKWIHMSYVSLVTLFRATNQLEEAQQYELALADWMKKNPKFDASITWEQIHSSPEELDDFCQQFFALATKLKAFTEKRGLRNLKDLKLKLKQAENQLTE